MNENHQGSFKISCLLLYVSDHPARKFDVLAALWALCGHAPLAVHQLLVCLQLLGSLEDLVEALALGAEEGVLRVRTYLVLQLVGRQLGLAGEPFDALVALVWFRRVSFALLEHKNNCWSNKNKSL